MSTILLMKADYERAGGPEMLLHGLAETIDRRRFDPVLAVIRRPPQAPLFAYPDSLRQVEIAWGGPGALLAAAWRAAAVAHETKAALVHTHDMRANAVGAVLRSVHRIPWIAHVHGWLGHTHHGRWRLYEAIDRRVIRAADLVLVGSYAAQREVRASDARHVEVVPNAVAIPNEHALAGATDAVRAEIGIPDGVLLLGVLGRLHPGKGQEIFLRALAALVGAGTQVHGVIVGEGPDEQRLRALADRLGLSDRVFFTGFVADTARYLRAMDVVAVPSLKDSMPLTALEAMALARPVVAAAAGDLPVVIEQASSGFLVPIGDPVALAERLATLIADAALRRRIGAAARRRVVAAYSAEAMARRLEAHYEAVIAATRADAA